MIKRTLPPPEFATGSSARPPPLPTVAGHAKTLNFDPAIGKEKTISAPHYSSAPIPPKVLKAEVSAPVAPKLQPEIAILNQTSLPVYEPKTKTSFQLIAITAVSVFGALVLVGGGG